MENYNANDYSVRKDKAHQEKPDEATHILQINAITPSENSRLKSKKKKPYQIDNIDMRQVDISNSGRNSSLFQMRDETYNSNARQQFESPVADSIRDQGSKRRQVLLNTKSEVAHEI